MSAAVHKTFMITELANHIFRYVPTRDLIVARRICKRFDQLITSNQTPLTWKLFFAPSMEQPTEYIIWKHLRHLRQPFQPYLGNAIEAQADHRARPIYDLNPAIVRFEARPIAISCSGTTYGFQDAIVDFDANAFTMAIVDDSEWETTLLTQPGCTTVCLEIKTDVDACVAYLKEQNPRQNVLRYELPEIHRKVDVLPTSPDGFVTLKDVKVALRAIGSEKWAKMQTASLTIEGCVTELSNCVRHARARERGEVVDEVWVPNLPMQRDLK